jgi:hypothetical protein
VGFQEPQRLVERARIAGQNIGRIRVACLVGVVDGRAGIVGGKRIALYPGRQMVLRLVDIGVIGL